MISIVCIVITYEWELKGTDGLLSSRGIGLPEAK